MKRREIGSLLKSILKVPQVPVPPISREGRRGKRWDPRKSRTSPNLFIPSGSEQKLLQSQAEPLRAVSMSTETLAGKQKQPAL